MRVSLLIRRTGDSGWRAPTVTAWTAEGELQAMLRRSPELIPSEDERRPIAMAPEYPVSVGSVDLVGVSVSGSLTVVECKLRANPEIRRNVVGQLFAYGSALWGMSYEAFDEGWRRRTGMGLADEVAREAAERGLDFDRESFVAGVTSSLEDGRFTLVVAVDEITEELQRIIEYLSAHTVADVDVAALELGYVAEGDLEILVPQAYGLELAEQKSKTTRGTGAWTEEEVFAALADEAATGVVRALQEWAVQRRLRVIGTTTKAAALAWHLDALGNDYTFFLADSRHNEVWLYFNSLEKKPVLDDPSRMAALVATLRTRFTIPEPRVHKVPSIPMAELADDAAFRVFTAAWDAVIDDIRRAEAERQ